MTQPVCLPRMVTIQLDDRWYPHRSRPVSTTSTTGGVAGGQPEAECQKWRESIVSEMEFQNLHNLRSDEQFARL